MKFKSRKKPVKPPKNLTGKSIQTPQGPIRPNNRKPFTKATEKERDERTEFVFNMMFGGLKTYSKADIHEVMLAKYNLDWSTVDKIYIPRARNLAYERANRTKEDVKVEAFMFYDAAKRDSKLDPRLKFAAVKEMCELVGAYSPKYIRNEISGPEGKPIATESVMSVEKLSEDDLDKIVSEGVRRGMAEAATITASRKLVIGSGNGNGG